MSRDKSAFFKDEISEILNAELKDEYPDELRMRVEAFVRDCVGAADGEMDICFQENGRGYYAHLHELERLRDVSLEDYLEYRRKLLLEINNAMYNKEKTHQMKVVHERLSRLKD